MKKILTGVFLVIILLGIGGFVVYKYFMADLIADAILSQEDLPSFVPSKVKTKLDKYRVPINFGAEEVIKKMHESKITLDQIITAIDEAPEDQAHALLDELKATKIKSSNQVFDMVKERFPVPFNVEVFRKPFNEKVDVKIIRKGISYATMHADDIDIAMAKSVAKKILLQKEKEYNEVMGYN
jgi:hypothetical protein